MNPTAPTTTPAALVDVDDAAAAADHLAALIDHERALHRQADTKATGSFALVGLLVATASTVLPRLDGLALGLAAAALVGVVLAGLVLGVVLVPRPAPLRYGVPQQVAEGALDRARRPARRLSEHAVELSRLENVTEVKHTLVRAGLGLLGVAFVLALAAAITLAAT